MTTKHTPTYKLQKAFCLSVTSTPDTITPTWGDANFMSQDFVDNNPDIVRAVNNHTKLIEALEKIRKEIQTNTSDTASANLVLATINDIAQTALDAARGKA